MSQSKSDKKRTPSLYPCYGEAELETAFLCPNGLDAPPESRAAAEQTMRVLLTMTLPEKVPTRAAVFENVAMDIIERITGAFPEITLAEAVEISDKLIRLAEQSESPARDAFVQYFTRVRNEFKMATVGEFESLKAILSDDEFDDGEEENGGDAPACPF